MWNKPRLWRLGNLPWPTLPPTAYSHARASGAGRTAVSWDFLSQQFPTPVTSPPKFPRTHPVRPPPCKPGLPVPPPSQRPQENPPCLPEARFPAHPQAEAVSPQKIPGLLQNHNPLAPRICAPKRSSNGIAPNHPKASSPATGPRHNGKRPHAGGKGPTPPAKAGLPPSHCWPPSGKGHGFRRSAPIHRASPNPPYQKATPGCTAPFAQAVP